MHLLLSKQLGAGERYRIESIDEAHDGAAVLWRMGFVPGKEISLRASAPWGDPISVEMDQACYAIRHELARAVRLVRVEEG